MERDHVHVLVEQSHGGIALLGRVEPHVEPHHLDGGLGVDRAHAQREGVDALQHFRNGKPGHEPGHAGLAHAAGCNTGEVAAFVVARVGSGHIGRGLVAGDGLELHVWIVLRHLERGLHVAKAGRENDLVAGGGQVADHALGVGPFSHVLDKRGLHLVAQRGLDGFAAFVMLARPACLGDGRDIDKTGFDRLRHTALGGRGLGKSGGEKTGGHERGCEVFVHGGPLHGPETEKAKGCRDSSLCHIF